MPTQERMYKVEDVQRRLGVGRATAYKLVSTGEIPSYRVAAWGWWKEEDKLRMLECPCGIHLKARNDAELARDVLTHAREEHNQLNLTEEQARELVARHSVDTEDASH